MGRIGGTPISCSLTFFISAIALARCLAALLSFLLDSSMHQSIIMRNPTTVNISIYLTYLILFDFNGSGHCQKSKI